MRRHLALLLALPAVALASGAATAESWLFRPSAYSHDPATCQRVNQYQPEKPALAPEDPTYMESGYRHLHTSIIGPDGSYDHAHIVQTWGAGELIRPYGEWDRPYRAGATPFGPWGNPQGPWTLPLQSWQNPYGLGRLPNGPWLSPGNSPSGPPSPYGPLQMPSAQSPSAHGPLQMPVVPSPPPPGP